VAKPSWTIRYAATWSQVGTMLSGNVRIIALAKLRGFLNRRTAYAEARDPVTAWYRQVKAADWATPADVKRDVRSASILKDGRVVFNIAGNKYRMCGSTTLIASST
jgi:mRNA interferase HigB